MTERSKPSAGQATRRETWAYRVGLASTAVFVAVGLYLVVNPTDALTTVFVILLIITLALGLLAGLVAVYSD